LPEKLFQAIISHLKKNNLFLAPENGNPAKSRELSTLLWIYLSKTLVYQAVNPE